VKTRIYVSLSEMLQTDLTIAGVHADQAASSCDNSAEG
jgi:hypothetical protein